MEVIIIIAFVGVFFSGEDKTANVTPVSSIVEQINSKFASIPQC